MSQHWKQDFANEVEKAILHEMTQRAIDELLFNLRSDRNGLQYYGLLKLCNTVGHVARAQALGIDVNTLRMEAEESAEWHERIATAFVDADKSVIFVIDDDDDDAEVQS